jgi:surfactin synthase thioesterase subunit
MQVCRCSMRMKLEQVSKSGTNEIGHDLHYLPWTNSLVVEREKGVRARLFCLPFAGAGASVFREWPRKLPGTVQVIALQLPGRESRWNEPPCQAISEMLDQLVENLWPMLDQPFGIFGHSMGAMLGFELARALQRNGKPAMHLFVSALRPPQDPDPDPPMHRLTDEELIGHLRRLNGIPSPILDHPEVIALFLPVLRADLKICETYEYRAGEPLNCPISVYGGANDTKAPPASLDGWRIQTTREFTMRLFPGDHFFLEPARDVLLPQIFTDLMRSLGNVHGTR